MFEIQGPKQLVSAIIYLFIYLYKTVDGQLKSIDYLNHEPDQNVFILLQYPEVNIDNWTTSILLGL